MSNPKSYPLERSEEEWKNQLDEQSYRILIEKGTEYPFTGEYNDHFEKGIYCCKGCGTPLYRSENKFDSSCGWPSYDEALPGAIEYIKDNSHGMLRTEIVCAHCGGHQGHVFNDGPTATGLRYCVNSASIDFNPE
jgi:peptide-methionine (R)-S-oxide reductase